MMCRKWYMVLNVSSCREKNEMEIAWTFVYINAYFSVSNINTGITKVEKN